MNLEEKFDFYLREFKRHQDRDGFILTNKCDSLLFSCLAGCVEGVTLVPDAAEGEHGQWFRRPLEYSEWGTNTKTLHALGYPECYECGGSKSTISRDMLLGLAWYAWCNKRLDISEGVIKYALKNFGIMGKGVPSRTFIGPGLLATFAWISYKLGGPSRPWLRCFPADLGITKGIVDYQAHLQVLHTHLRFEITGRKRDGAKCARVASAHVNRVRPLAALDFNIYFEYVASLNPDMDPDFRRLDRKLDAVILESDLYGFPNDRLPTNGDYKAEWKWERDPKDWQGVDNTKEHTGGDFLWASAWYLGKIKGQKR